MACSSYRIVNNSDKYIYFDYQRCDNSMWEYQVPVPVGQSSNFWAFEGTVKYPKFYNDLIEFQELSDAPPTDIEYLPTPGPINGNQCVRVYITNTLNKEVIVPFIDCIGSQKYITFSPAGSLNDEGLLECVGSIEQIEGVDMEISDDNNTCATCVTLISYHEGVAYWDYTTGYQYIISNLPSGVFRAYYLAMSETKLWRVTTTTTGPDTLIEYNINLNPFIVLSESRRFQIETSVLGGMEYKSENKLLIGDQDGISELDISSSIPVKTILFGLPYNSTCNDIYYDRLNEKLIITYTNVPEVKAYIGQFSLDGNLELEILLPSNTYSLYPTGVFTQNDELYLMSDKPFQNGTGIYKIDKNTYAITRSDIRCIPPNDRWTGIPRDLAQPPSCRTVSFNVTEKSISLNYDEFSQDLTCTEFSGNSETYYYSGASGLTEGTVLYKDSDKTILADNGFYAGRNITGIVVDELEGFRIISGGVVSDIITCPSVQNCDSCTYVRVEITQQLIDSASGNTNSSLNGKVYWDSSFCTFDGQWPPISFTETFSSPILKQSLAFIIGNIYYYQDNTLKRNNTDFPRFPYLQYTCSLCGTLSSPYPNVKEDGCQPRQGEFSYSDVSQEDACNNLISLTLFIQKDVDSLQNGVTVYRDNNLTLLAIDGFYAGVNFYSGAETWEVWSFEVIDGIVTNISQCVAPTEECYPILKFDDNFYEFNTNQKTYNLLGTLEITNELIYVDGNRMFTYNNSTKTISEYELTGSPWTPSLVDQWVFEGIDTEITCFTVRYDNTQQIEFVLSGTKVYLCVVTFSENITRLLFDVPNVIGVNIFGQTDLGQGTSTYIYMDVCRELIFMTIKSENNVFNVVGLYLSEIPNQHPNQHPNLFYRANLGTSNFTGFYSNGTYLILAGLDLSQNSYSYYALQLLDPYDIGSLIKLFTVPNPSFGDLTGIYQPSFECRCFNYIIPFIKSSYSENDPESPCLDFYDNCDNCNFYFHESGITNIQSGITLYTDVFLNDVAPNGYYATINDGIYQNFRILSGGVISELNECSLPITPTPTPSVTQTPNTPTPTATPSPTPTLNVKTFQLNYDTTGQTEACLGFSISCEDCYYYTSPSVTGITEGMILYTDVSLETLAPAGYYAGGPLPIVVDELEGFRIVSAGTVSDIVICPSPTPTNTPTVTPTPSTTSPETTPTATPSPTPTLNVKTFQLNYDTTGQTEACLGFSISCEDCYYYTSPSVTGITEGMILYTDVSLETLAPAGYYAGGPLPIVVDELEGFRIVSAGTVSDIVICPSPTPTNTPSPTPTSESPTPTPTITPSSTPLCVEFSATTGIELLRCPTSADTLYVTGWELKDSGDTISIIGKSNVTWTWEQIALGSGILNISSSGNTIDLSINQLGPEENILVRCDADETDVLYYYRLTATPTSIICPPIVFEVYRKKAL